MTALAVILAVSLVALIVDRIMLTDQSARLIRVLEVTE